VAATAQGETKGLSRGDLRENRQAETIREQRAVEMGPDVRGKTQSDRNGGSWCPAEVSRAREKEGGKSKRAREYWVKKDKREGRGINGVRRRGERPK